MTLDRWLYQAGMQCAKRMYWQSRGREAASGGTYGLVLRFARETRLAARGLWPGGVAVDLALPAPAAAAETRRLMEQEQARVIFDALVEHEGVPVRIDVLERSRRMKWYVTAVRSGSQVQDRHVQDLAFQVWAARGAGLDVREASVATLNRDYVRNGVLDCQAMFSIRNATPRVEALLPRIEQRVERLREALAAPAAPAVDAGPHCDVPFPCEYQDDCWPELEPDDIQLLPSLHGHRKKELLDAGIRRVGEIPDRFALNERQRRARQAILENRMIWSGALRADLGSLAFPLWCIDFEAVAPAIPRFEGTRPWQQVPFQWSAHRLDSPWGEPHQFGFLADGTCDPRHEFTRTLLDTVDGGGSVLVWSKPFEEGRLKELQEALPEFAAPIQALRERFVDLLEIVRKHVYHPAFRGSFSIKSVLPALVPDLSYEGLSVSRGDEASLAFDRLSRDGLGPAEAARIRAALEEYCRLDTLAMVRILEVLHSRVFTRAAT